MQEKKSKKKHASDSEESEDSAVLEEAEDSEEEDCMLPRVMRGRVGAVWVWAHGRVSGVAKCGR